MRFTQAHLYGLLSKGVDFVFLSVKMFVIFSFPSFLGEKTKPNKTKQNQNKEEFTFSSVQNSQTLTENTHLFM